MADALPILDLAPLRAGDAEGLRRLGGELHDALTRFGFFFIRNHGVPWTLVDRTFAEAERFHAQPLDAKMAMQFNQQIDHTFINAGFLCRKQANRLTHSFGTKIFNQYQSTI